MRKRAFLLALVVAVVGAVVFGGPALAGKPGLRTTLEADLGRSPSTEIAGTAYIHLYPTKNKICYRVTVDDTVRPVDAAHLHRGSEGETGKAVLNLKALDRGECIRGLGERFIRNVKRHPERYYVDVHTSNPNGDVRGQLSR